MSIKSFTVLAMVAVASLVNTQELGAQGLTQVNRLPTPAWNERPGKRVKQKKMALMPGNVAKENIQKVTSEIRWNTNLNSALGQAHRQNKMVFWVHLVGNLSGAT